MPYQSLHLTLMTQALSQELLNRARRILSPAVDTDAERRALVQSAFIAESLRDQFDYQGSAHEFATNCIARLLDYGFLPSGEHALARLLRTLREQVGLEGQAEIDELIRLLDELATTSHLEQESDQTVSLQRRQELVYLNSLKADFLRERYVGLDSRSEEQFRFYSDWGHKVELLPLDKDGNWLPKRRVFDDAVDAIREVRRAALLGDPGGGKTTAIWKLVLEMGEIARHDPQAPIPLLVALREWTRAEQSLPDFIAARLKGLGAYLHDLLSNGRAALLLDGLNELPRDQWRNKHEQVRQFVEENPELLAVVSCRKEDYPRELGFNCISLSPLDPLRIREFAGKYLDSAARGKDLLWKLAGADAEELQRQFLEKFDGRLLDAERVFWLNTQLPGEFRWGWWDEDNSHWENWVKRRDDHAGMLTLAGNPFMLTMLAGVYASGGGLPPNRGNLFHSFVQIRLNRELEGKRILPTEMKPLTDALAEIAFEMQSRRAPKEDEESDDENAGGALTVLPKREVLALLGDNAQRLLSLAANAGLLNTDDAVRFTHQLLQEYFAARFMQIKLEDENWKASQIWSPDKWWQRTNWEVAAVLFAGLYNNDCTRAVEWIADANPEVAAQCLERSGVGHTLANAARERLRSAWLERLTDFRNEPVPARAAIGRALGLTGWDNRPEVMTLSAIEWKKIPGGKFKYGHKDEDDNKPQTLTLPAFSISRFPITQAQFQTFLDDPEGAADPRWFDGLTDNEDDRRIEEPYFKFANHPRDNVSWIQAMAFCRWWSWREGTTYDLDKVAEWAVRLPTEFEWERAARGKNGLVYPYGNDYDLEKGNTARIIGQTSAVGIFPNGASPDGVEEMSGNVWEWCLSNYDNPAIDPREEDLRAGNVSRVLRGGSWFYDHLSARAVYRNDFHPAYRYVSSGFRLVVLRPPSS